MTVEFILNGAPVSVRSDHPHLLAALREELDVTSPKDGCSPQGQCGCCTVMIDGKVQISCTYAVEKAAGRVVTTLEGVDEAERTRFSDAFAACGGLQCGYCIPGIVMRAKAQIDKKGAGLQRDDMARHLGAHLCRCTGYVKVLDAIEAVAKGTPVDPALPGGIGTSGAKYEAAELTLGDRGYVDDLRVPGMLHGALHLTAHVRADIVRIDTSVAAAADGVVGVFTAADIPGEQYVGIIYKDWPVFIGEGQRTSYAGDVLAIVVAETKQQARAAAALVQVEYGVLRPIVDPVAAIDDPEIAVFGTKNNVLSVSEYARGNTDDSLAASAHVVHEVFNTQRIEHAFLEPESTLAVPGDGHLLVYSGGQGVWDDRDQIAALLGVGIDAVTVELVSNGGAFGGKEDMSNQGQTALAAFLLQRPVKCTLSREESFLIHAKRHPIRLEYWAGCDADGHLTALRVRGIGDSGAYASVGMKVLERAAGHASGPYRVPDIDVHCTAVRTNNPVCGAFRGFGANQAQFAMEGVMDRLAEQVGISGWEMRKRNVIRPGEVWGPGQIMDDGAGGAEACLDRAKPHIDAALAAGKAVGMGLGLKNSGLGNGLREVCAAVVRFRSADGRVEVRHGFTEMGQGVHTVALQTAVTELGIDPARIEVIVDTTRQLGFGQTTGSRGTLMVAASVQHACRVALAAECAPDVDHYAEHVVDWTQKLGDPAVPNPTIHAAFGFAAQVVVADRDTGAIEKVVAIHDVGRAVNPRLCEGQIEGSVHMGLGYALTEDFPSDEHGFPTNMTLRSLGILRPKDVPPIEVELVEVPQPRSAYGIKGVGEIGLVPTSGAVAAALHMVDGVWRSTLPMGRVTADD
ncbi:MAG: molybdopterin-dependent oxidoreductase [Ilumatobacteraceae bacterium]|nr:molybdopterin-dependent oxidoreductase [Ilumatobacteraceae bacterium]MBP8208033.1 molybdopterin-dependent oxidoreductase [Ilumatobacteraceae bacterium]MBP9052523.1 molybdopterin-dependent oxidoreductase [Ilumatobacteraceae bacterium]HRA85768.1 molybdopterin-dependent oxidoreductase [Ilumatobacteraceae bacterium]HRC47082.1 molybdopterin-dependent oxidoreductase [Ilumatobacteraceae bacterium]